MKFPCFGIALVATQLQTRLQETSPHLVVHMLH